MKEKQQHYCSACGISLSGRAAWTCVVAHNPEITINLCAHCENVFFWPRQITPQMKARIFDTLYDQGAFDSVLGFSGTMSRKMELEARGKKGEEVAP